MGTDPTLEAVRDVLADGFEEIRRALDGVASVELNARPGGEGTNSLAVIAAHSLASTRSWLSLAMGAPLPPRDRPAEFRTVAGDGFVAWVEEMIGECLALVRDDAAYDPAREAPAPWRSDAPEAPVTAAWALLHAISHLGEHVGHAHLTRELLPASH